MEERTVSSIFTFPAKFIAPAIWIVGLGAVLVALWAGAFQHGPDPLPEWVNYPLTAVWLAGTLFQFFYAMRLVRVRVGGDYLKIDNYSREISVPFTQVLDLWENRWVRGNPTTITFREPTAFGKKVRFLPKGTLGQWFYQRNCSVEELRRLAGLND
jgi:hypothetical protein